MAEDMYKICSTCEGTGHHGSYNGEVVCNKCEGTGFENVESIYKSGYRAVITALRMRANVRKEARDNG